MRRTGTSAVTTVFVPLIGFRPAATRTLRERVESSEDGTLLVVHAVAAAPDRTDMVIEWQRTGDPAICPPDSRILAHANRAPLDQGLAAELVTRAAKLQALSVFRRAYQMSHASIGAIDALRFLALPDDLEQAELRLREGTTEWRVPFSLFRGGIAARPLALEVTKDGVVIRATAMCRHKDELVVELDVEATTQIRQVGGPVPSPQSYLDTSAADRAARRASMQRYFGAQAAPITLEDDQGGRHEEVGRLFSNDPQQVGSGPFISSFCVMFDAPDSTGVALVIPFVELNDFGSTATVDLRELPRDVALSEHRFRVAALEERDSDKPKILLELAPSAAAPRFVQPARVHGADPEFGWQRQTVARGSPERTVISMATTLGDPPIVTFSGVVLRVDGPLRLDLPL